MAITDEGDRLEKLSNLIIHPKVRALSEARITRLRKVLPSRDEVEQIQKNGGEFSDQDCREKIGPFFEIERRLEDNKFLEMLLAQQVDNAEMARHIIYVNKQLMLLNEHYIRAKAEIAELKKLVRQLREALD